MKQIKYLPLLLLILISNSCTVLSPTASETIKIECTEENIDATYNTIQPIIRSMDEQEINNEIIEKYPEIKKENFIETVLITSKITKKLNIENNENNSSSVESYTVYIGINVDCKKAKSNQIALIMNYYKEHIKKTLASNNINIEIDL